MLANLTPPVALAAFAGAGISGGNPTKTGFQAVKLALAGFVVPYIFVFSPQLLLIDTTFLGVIPTLITAIIGVVALGAAVEGYLFRKLNIVFRILMFSSAIMLMISGSTSDLTGLAIFAAIFLYLKTKSKGKVILNT